jgi:transcriptional regulator with XRE-family HTH domain
MAPRKVEPEPSERVKLLAGRIASALGSEIRAERLRRAWSLRTLGARARLSIATLQGIESGAAGSVESYARVAAAFGWDPRFVLQPVRFPLTQRDVDPVHAAMGELEAHRLSRPGSEVRLDEPYQHYQFSGRADLVSIDRARMALLHIENRTRFPDVQGFAGSWNAKRAYLAKNLADRLEVTPSRWRSITHVVVALWSAEVLHPLRLRAQTFRSACPDPAGAFAGWWMGSPPDAGTSSTLVVLDPLPGRRSSRRQWIDLETALDRATDPRYRGYSEAVEALRRAGLA